MTIRYVSLALATPSAQLFLQEASTLTLATRTGALFLSLVALKVAIGVGLVFYSAGAHERDDDVYRRNPAVLAHKQGDHGGAVHHNVTHPAAAVSSGGGGSVGGGGVAMVGVGGHSLHPRSNSMASDQSRAGMCSAHIRRSFRR